MHVLNYAQLLLQATTLAIIGWLIRSYFPTYLSEKGKNLATKEDIGSITAEVERVRSLYAADLERTKSELQQKIQVTGHQLALALDSSNRYQNLQTQAYVDFIKGVAGIAMAQRYQDPKMELEFSILLTDAKARIAVYGGRDVLLQLGGFFETYGALTSDGAMISFLDAIHRMRRETVSSSDWGEKQAISQLLFSQSIPGAAVSERC